MLPATYVSSDALERDEAYRRGYVTVCQHPREIGVLERSDMLVIDANQFLFDDHELAIRIANEAARRGVLVGIHTYYPEDPKLHKLAKLPNVLVAKTHRRLLHDLGRYAKLNARLWRKIAVAAKPLKGEVNNVHEYFHEGTIADETALPSALNPALEEADVLFPPSPELGAQLEHLEQAQVEIDRKKAEELARLRELQDRD